MLMLLLVQAIQARQVLRGTVAELVKETRKQEAEGALFEIQSPKPALMRRVDSVQCASANLPCSLALPAPCQHAGHPVSSMSPAP